MTQPTTSTPLVMPCEPFLPAWHEPTPRFGLDIVWLSDPHNVGRGSDERLLSRILAPCERTLVAAAKAPDLVLWRLWSIKEACFKAESRGVPKARFMPRHIVPLWDDHERDELLAGRPARGKWNALVFASSIENDVAVATAIASDQSWQDLKFDVVVAPTAHDAQKSLRAALRAHFARAKGGILLVKDEWGGRTGAPAALLAQKRVALSLSHDGPYFAFAFWLEGVA